MDSFGPYLRREREALGLSLDEAARRIGMSKSRLRELETGLSLKTKRPTGPTAENVAMVARGLGLDRDHLAGLAGLGYKTDPRTDEESELLAAFRALPAAQRRTAIRVVRALLEPGDVADRSKI